MESTRTRWKASGFIAQSGVLYPVELDTPYLIFDSDSWAKKLVMNLRLSAEEALIDGDEDFANSSMAEALSIEASLSGRPVSDRVNWPLNMRQELEPRVVGSFELFEHYSLEIWRRSYDPPVGFTPSFLLELGVEPQLSILPRFKAQIEHSGFVRAVACDQEELVNRISLLGFVCPTASRLE